MALAQPCGAEHGHARADEVQRAKAPDELGGDARTRGELEPPRLGPPEEVRFARAVAGGGYREPRLARRLSPSAPRALLPAPGGRSMSRTIRLAEAPLAHGPRRAAPCRRACHAKDPLRRQATEMRLLAACDFGSFGCTGTLRHGGGRGGEVSPRRGGQAPGRSGVHTTIATSSGKFGQARRSHRGGDRGGPVYFALELPCPRAARDSPALDQPHAGHFDVRPDAVEDRILVDGQITTRCLAPRTCPYIVRQPPPCSWLLPCRVGPRVSRRALALQPERHVQGAEHGEGSRVVLPRAPQVSPAAR